MGDFEKWTERRGSLARFYECPMFTLSLGGYDKPMPCHYIFGIYLLPYWHSVTSMKKAIFGLIPHALEKTLVS